MEQRLMIRRNFSYLNYEKRLFSTTQLMRKTPPLFCLDIRSCLPPGLRKSALKLYMTLWLLDFALLTRQFRFYNTMMPICEKSLKCFFVSLNILNKSLIQIPPFPVIPLTLLVLVLWIQQ